MNKIIAILLSCCLLTSLLSGCSHVSDDPDIVATTLPVYDFTTRLTQGTDLTVKQLINEPVSCLHNYSLQVSQMRTVEAADVLVINGAGYESFLHNVIHSKNSIIDASAGIDLKKSGHLHHHEEKQEFPEDHYEPHEHEKHDEHHHHSGDPHIWMSPINASAMARNIADGLKEQFPDYSETISENLNLLLSELSSLQEYGERALSNLRSRDMITFHDGFHYFADDFDLNIIRSIEEEPGSETSALELKELITFVREQQVPAIFTEKNGSTASANVISEETDCGVFTLDMVMYGDGYFESMYHNIDTIKEALG